MTLWGVSAARSDSHLSGDAADDSARERGGSPSPRKASDRSERSCSLQRRATDSGRGERSERKLAEARDRFRYAFDDSPVGMVLLDLDLRFVQVNDAFCAIVGYRRDQLKGMRFDVLTHPDDIERNRENMLAVLAGTQSSYMTEKRYTHADGHEVTVALHSAVLRSPDGTPLNFLTHVQDISERKRHDQQLRYLADHDALTGLLNRRGFNHELGAHAARIDRYGRTGAVMVIDLDQFKLVNDTLGHHAGDQLIICAARLLASRLRSTDVLARLGGDEFGVLLPKAGPQEALQVGESLRHTLHDAGSELGRLTRPITASIGIATFQDAGARTAEEVIVNADLAMYDAKEPGRDRVAIVTSERQRPPRIKTRLGWIDRIRGALDDERFVLYAQAVLELSTGNVRQHELLLRMLDENGQVILPGSFIHVAERYDLIQEIDRWVVREAIRMLEQHAAAGQQLTVEINISGKSLSDDLLPELIEAELKRSTVDPASLIFEVTETAAVANIDLARRFAQRLASFGCRFALDDFGAGFGSFYYIKHLPFDYIKIHHEFITNCITNRTDQLVIGSLVAIAKGLHKQTIAEGFENTATQLFLRATVSTTPRATTSPDRHRSPTHTIAAA